ncbi:histidine kinase [Amycolatopsis endophytica]|uniref:histidine kinase n=1 Tax=Amycolatopsis endophytica TaxID=860233 RepID=A0A853AZW3_9PSEU|nr:histidine kinase [Amycolatopsis endophytica]NYI88192.1 signal transduction histidine kinase [Amycolatopsis endophytica]
METTTRVGRGTAAELGWPVPVLGAMCAVLAGMPAGTVLPTVSALAILLVALGNALGRRRRPRLVEATSAAAAVVSVLTTFRQGGGSANGLAAWLLLETVLLLCVLVQVVRTVPRMRALLVGGAVTAAVVLAPLRLTAGARASPQAADVGAWCFCWSLVAVGSIAIGLYLRSLDDARVESVRVARRDQRLRLARDLHDWLAHEVTGLILEAQAARVPGRGPVDSDSALKNIEDAGVRVLDSIDKVLQWLRAEGDIEDGAEGETLPTIADLPGLVSRFEALGSFDVRLEFDERTAGLQPEVTSTAYRIVLEALTNVRRHAPAARQVVVEVHRNGAHLIVRVANDGLRRSGRFRRSRAGGTGLRGLGERITALGGTLWAGPVGPVGWALHAVLPVNR